MEMNESQQRSMRIFEPMWDILIKMPMKVDEGLRTSTELPVGWNSPEGNKNEVFNTPGMQTWALFVHVYVSDEDQFYNAFVPSKDAGIRMFRTVVEDMQRESDE